MGLNVSDNVVRPVLGLTGYLQRAKSGVWDVPMTLLPAVYVEGVTSAGGIAMVLPPQPVDRHSPVALTWLLSVSRRRGDGGSRLAGGGSGKWLVRRAGVGM